MLQKTIKNYVRTYAPPPSLQIRNQPRNARNFQKTTIQSNGLARAPTKLSIGVLTGQPSPHRLGPLGTLPCSARPLPRGAFCATHLLEQDPLSAALPTPRPWAGRGRNRR